jgi:tetratricopeptide (TPR) repeat protein
LDIKYNKHKQELREDPILGFLLDTKDQVKKNQKLISGGLIAVVVVVAGLTVFNFNGNANEKKIQSTFGSAMISYENNQMDRASENLKIVAEKYPNSPQGMQSGYLLGGILFEQGRYDDAKKFFEIASKEHKEFLGAQAIEGIAACYEAKGDVPSSLKYLEKALADDRIAYRHGAIRWKMALLKKSSDLTLTKKLCNEIIADTTASEYHQPAQNLLAVINNAG